jgi:hypothetical protein
VVDLDEILYGGDDIEDDLDSILLNPVAGWMGVMALNITSSTYYLIP